jgi:GH24 family phage-related lysozyme (muramidase)
LETETASRSEQAVENRFLDMEQELRGISARSGRSSATRTFSWGATSRSFDWARAQSAAQRVLVILIENGGIDLGIPDLVDKILAAVPGTSLLPDDLKQKLIAFLRQQIKSFTDDLLETAELAANRYTAARPDLYADVVVLRDGTASYADLKGQLIAQSQAGKIVDLFILTHGSENYISVPGGIDDGQIRQMKTEFGKPLSIRSVYMMNCKGSTLNDAWLAAGARVSSGSRKNNYLPEPTMFFFWQNWKAGQSFESAVTGAYAATVKAMNDAVRGFLAALPVPGSGMLGNAIDFGSFDFVRDSAPVIDGQRSLTISTDDVSFSQSTSTGMVTTVVPVRSLSDGDAGAAGGAMTVSDAGVDLVKEWEGFVPNLYNDAVGHCTVGYGTLVHKGNCDGRDSEQPYVGGVSKEEATRLLAGSLGGTQTAVNGAVKVALNQNQFDALVSFVYNIGAGAFQQSTLLRLLNQGKYDEVPGELKKWVKARKDGQLIDLPGLVKRRAAEAALFEKRVSPATAQSLWSVQQDTPLSPFPARFADPLSGNGNKKLNDAFQAAATAVKASHPHLPDVAKLPIIIVPLCDDHTRPFTGFNVDKQYYSGSMLKFAAMFAAYQLRHAVNHLGATLDPAKVTDPDKFFDAVRKEFDSQILKASDLLQPSSVKTAGKRPPQYNTIFLPTKDAAGKWSVTFRSDVDPKLDFDGHLRKMVVDSHNPSAGFCIQALGFSWIDGLLQKVGLFDSKSKRGIWLAGDYLWPRGVIVKAHDAGTADAEKDEEFDLGVGGWAEVRIPSENDGPSKQCTTCIDAARLLVLLVDQKLVATTDPHDTANDEMLGLMHMAVTGAGAASIVNRYPTLGAPFTVLHTKIGVGTLGTTGNCNPDSAGHTKGCILSESLIGKQAANPFRRFVVVWQNVKDPANDGYEEIAQIRELIQKTMDGL